MKIKIMYYHLEMEKLEFSKIEDIGKYDLEVEKDSNGDVKLYGEHKDLYRLLYDLSADFDIDLI